MRRVFDLVWPLLCVLACLVVFATTRTQVWQVSAKQRPIPASPHAKDLPPQPQRHDVVELPLIVAAEEPEVETDVEEPAETAHNPPAPQVLRLPPIAPIDRQTPGPAVELLLVTPSPRIASQWSDSSPSDSRIPAPPILAQRAVSHEELFPAGERIPVSIQVEPANVETSKPAEGESKNSSPTSEGDGPVVAPRKSRQSPKPAPSEQTKPSSADESPSPLGIWPVPAPLLESLDGLAAMRGTESWASESAGLVRKLSSTAAADREKTATILDRLGALVEGVGPLAASLDDGSLARRLWQAGYALDRRLVVWREVFLAGGATDSQIEPSAADRRQLARRLAEVEAATRDSAKGKGWRDYLLVDALRAWSDRPKSSPQKFPSALARRVLERIGQTPLSVPQRRFVASGPVAALRAELRRWAAEPVDAGGLLGHIERYEQSGLGSDATRLAADWRYLRASAGPNGRRLADRMESYYRNANVRVAVTQDLLNRLVPQREPHYERVRDRVLGVPTRGRSWTSSKVVLEMVPDPQRVRMALDASGQVSALTSSTSGPVTFYNDSESVYLARKPIEVDLRGIHLGRTEVQVFNDTRLRDLQTDFDGILLFGPLVKSVARSQHEQKGPEARREVEDKVACRVRQRVDAEAEVRFGEASQRLQQQILDPLAAMSLEPTLIQARTDRRRFTVRLRLAGEDQLGGHTPRPRAPSDSLASFQIHETVLNNILQRMQFEGRKFSLPALSQRVADRLQFDEPWETDPANADVRITFAKRDAVGVRLRDGRAALTLSIAKLSKGRRRWRNFQIRVFYRPHSEGCTIELVRDGVIQLIGRRLTTGSQIALRGIFSRTFHKYRPVNLTPPRMENNPKLADLAVTQFAVEDGWIGIAFGPAENLRTASAR